MASTVPPTTASLLPNAVSSGTRKRIMSPPADPISTNAIHVP